jgi:hypothetical protein
MQWAFQRFEQRLIAFVFLHLNGFIDEKKHSQLKVVNINLLQAVVDYLAERNFIDKAIQMQKDKGQTEPTPVINTISCALVAYLLTR